MGGFQLRVRAKRNRGEKGFTLTEVMVSGVLITMVMTSVGQMLTSSLAGSSDMASRRRIEHSIEDNIQSIHHADTRLNHYLQQDTSRLEEACTNPTRFLADELNRNDSIAYVQQPVNKHANNSETILRTITADTDNGVTRVSYEFDGPGMSVKTERRVIELSPFFQAFCYRNTRDETTASTPQQQNNKSSKLTNQIKKERSNPKSKKKAHSKPKRKRRCSLRQRLKGKC